MAKNEKNQETNDQRVHHSGRGRLLAVGKLLPADFDWVRVTRTRTSGNEVWLHIRKLELSEAE